MLFHKPVMLLSKEGCGHERSSPELCGARCRVAQVQPALPPLLSALSPQILQADGGNYCACVNAATLATIDAGIPMRDYVCASSAGFIEDTPLADLNYVEEAAGGPQVALALLPKSDQIALLEMNSRLHEDHLEQVIEAASKACKDVYAVLDQVVREHVHEVTTLLGE
nr:exosome complex component RRP41 [Pelodiscus sinensis]|eukprot:XP_006116411.1 exosome complex component RRP41 [Pelodiscus sinensis]